MQSYIGSIKNSYMFTNNRKQVEATQQALANNETVEVYHYDKLGRQIQWEIVDPIDNEQITVLDNPLFLKDYRDKGYEIKPSYQGTGRILAKHRVVEVYRKEELHHILNGAEICLMVKVEDNKYYNLGSVKELGYNNQSYALKCELIEEVDMDLSDFVSWNKVKKYKQNVNFQVGGSDVYYGDGLYFESVIEAWNSVKSWVDSGAWENYDDFLLTKYNGLTRVIHIGGE